MAQAKTYKKRFQDKAKAEKYARRFEKGAHRRIDQREQRAVHQIFTKLNGCRSVLDVPSGAGRFVGALGQGNRLVIESDVAHEMVEIAGRRAEKAGVRARCLQSDAGRLPFVDGAVDCIFCNRLLHHILPPEERAMFLKEFHRVTRRWLVITFFDYKMFGAVRKTLKALKGRKPKYAEQPTFEQFEAEAKACGFRVRDVVPTGPVWVAEKYLVLEKT
jgi:ubiquinone/menaquinone biosynthesis C-methylase UbiE